MPVRGADCRHAALPLPGGRGAGPHPGQLDQPGGSLYTPLVDGIGNLDFGVLVPAGIGAVVTIVCLAKAINALFTHFYSCAFHAIVGIVIAATLVIIPFGSFTQGVGTAVANIVCLVVGVVAALALDKFNQSVPKEA